MNEYTTKTKKNLVPRIIDNGFGIFLGFVHENSSFPRRYYDFLDCYGGKVEDCVPSVEWDVIYPLTMDAYFELSQKLMKKKQKYNLMKKRHEYNTRKYRKI